MTPTNSGIEARVKILIADDNQAMREIVIEMLDADFEIVAVAADGRGVVNLGEKLEPAVGIIDIAMPDQTGLEAATELRARGSKMRIVFLTVHDDPDYLNAARECGASGYVIKREMGKQLRRAISTVLSGETYFPPYPVIPTGN